MNSCSGILLLCLNRCELSLHGTTSFCCSPGSFLCLYGLEVRPRITLARLPTTYWALASFCPVSPLRGFSSLCSPPVPLSFELSLAILPLPLLVRSCRDGRGMEAAPASPLRVSSACGVGPPRARGEVFVGPDAAATVGWGGRWAARGWRAGRAGHAGWVRGRDLRAGDRDMG